MATRVGLRVPGSVTFEDWEQAGRGLARMADTSAWCLGDWVVYGRNRFPDRYRRAVEAAGLDYQTVRNYVWVARRFEASRRRDRLSFGHHAEVAALPEDDQEHWLGLAERHKWSRNRLRSEIKRGSEAVPEPLQAAALPRIAVHPDRFDQWRRAAEHSRVPLEEWVITRLDSAAAESLGRPAASELREPVG